MCQPFAPNKEKEKLLAENALLREKTRYLEGFKEAVTLLSQMVNAAANRVKAEVIDVPPTSSESAQEAPR